MGKRLVITLLVVSVVAGCLWLVFRRTAPPIALTATAGAQPLGCKLERGDRLAFRVTSEVEARSAGDTIPADRFAAVLSWHVIDAPPTGPWLVRAAFSSLTLVQALTPVEQRVVQPLDASFLLRVRSDCRFEAKGYPREWQSATRRFASSMVSTFEFGVSQTGASWELEQTDGVGPYTASYQATRHADGSTTVTRKKRHSHQDTRGGSFGFQAQLLLANATATLERTGRWLERADGEERVRLKAQGTLLADLTQHYGLRRDDAAFVEPRAGADETSVDWQDPFSMPLQVRAAPSPEIVALSLSGALKRFEAVYHQSTKGDAYAAALMLAQWLRAHPDEASSLLAQVRAGAIDEALRPALFLALEQCGTPQARAVLSAALADRTLGELDRARASSALSDVPEPTRESAQALIAAARVGDSKLLASTGVRALGHLSGRTDALSPELRDELTEALRAELSTARDASRVVDVVDALGNTGDVRFAPEVTSRLVDASPSMREHAVRALRRMPAADVAPALLERLGREPEPGVRVAIVDALLTLGVRDAAAMTRAAQLLVDEPAPLVRAALIRWLGAAAELPVAKAALIAQFRRETVPQLLQLIGRYVSAEEL